MLSFFSAECIFLIAIKDTEQIKRQNIPWDCCNWQTPSPPQIQDWSKGNNSLKHICSGIWRKTSLKALALAKLLDWQLLKTRWAALRFHLEIHCSVKTPREDFIAPIAAWAKEAAQNLPAAQHREHHPCFSSFLFWEGRWGVWGMRSQFLEGSHSVCCSSSYEMNLQLASCKRPGTSLSPKKSHISFKIYLP